MHADNFQQGHSGYVAQGSSKCKLVNAFIYIGTSGPTLFLLQERGREAMKARLAKDPNDALAQRELGWLAWEEQNGYEIQVRGNRRFYI
jgi:hypothetical protein